MKTEEVNNEIVTENRKEGWVLVVRMMMIRLNEEADCGRSSQIGRSTSSNPTDSVLTPELRIPERNVIVTVGIVAGVRNEVSRSNN